MTGIKQEEIEEKIRQYFYTGSRLKLPDNNPVFALKLHQFISQGQALYATIESREDRYLTQEAQYYAPGDSQKKISIHLNSVVFVDRSIIWLNSIDSITKFSPRMV